MRTNWGIMALLGGALLAAGLVLGLTPLTVDGSGCGSALRGGFSEDFANSLSGNPRSLVGDCQDARNSRRTVSLAGSVPGLLLLVGAGIARSQTTARRASAAPQR